MLRIPTAIFAGIFTLALFVPSANCQQAAPLGDVARTQREIRKTLPHAVKKYTNVEVAAAPAASNDPDGAAPVAAIAEEPEVADAPRNTAPASRSVMDRDADPADAVFIVPAGTQLRVDISENKVIVPVRVGFATPIPALSKVAIRIMQLPYDAFYDQGSSVAELSSVTIEGVTYEVETDSVPLIFTSDTTFTLAKPLAIKR